MYHMSDSAVNFRIKLLVKPVKTVFSYIQTRRLSLFSHIVWTPDETDAEKILTAFHLLNWRRPPGRPLMDEDYPAGPEIQQPLPEWSNWHGSESSTLETDVYVWRYTLLVVHATKDVNKSGMAELWISHLGLPRTCNEVSEATDVVTELAAYER